MLLAPQEIKGVSFWETSRERLEGPKTREGEERDRELKSGVLCRDLQNDSKEMENRWKIREKVLAIQEDIYRFNPQLQNQDINSRNREN